MSRKNLRYDVGSDLYKSKKMRERWVYGMIFLGYMMFFRWEKYRLLTVLEGFRGWPELNSSIRNIDNGCKRHLDQEKRGFRVP